MDKKVVLITGSNRGIGFACAKYLNDKGYIVIGNYRSDKPNLDIDTYKADITKRDEVKNMIDYVINKYGKIDVLVNNAGIDQEKLFQDISDQEYKDIMNGNFYSNFITTQETVKYMLKQKSGSIINISSIYSTNGGSNASLYSASKGAINALTMSLAKELGPSNIRVNAIAPGCMNTDMNKYLNESEWNYLIDKTPLGKKGEGIDIARCIDWLINDEFTTGQIIKIDGGFSL